MEIKAGRTSIEKIVIGGKERQHGSIPLFKIGLRGPDGAFKTLSALDAGKYTAEGKSAEYGDFEGFPGIGVKLRTGPAEGSCNLDETEMRISVTGTAGITLEWVDYPVLALPALQDNNEAGDGGAVLYPYNEGVIVTDLEQRQKTGFRSVDPQYPSEGCFPVFPNMLCSQFMAYIWPDAGLYIGAHDRERGVKSLDFFPCEGGTALRIRHYCGVYAGESWEMNYPVVLAATGNMWQSAAERYRGWFERELPPKAVRTADDPTLPDWYADSPLVVSYPVRGIHDMDEMKPNKLYPYTRALPVLDEIRERTGARLMVLLMHWEGTAPWAPPYVWPPFGGTENFGQFREKLHEKGDLLGVYCSGFGYTVRSNLIAEYNMQEEYEREGLAAAMCAGPDNKVLLSRICTGQRSGYDICPASEAGKKLLSRAYRPLFKSGVDYAQILDQNHGGGQYFCYSRDHGHPPVPGPWMTRSMQQMLSEWNEEAPEMLFGCESASAEPFIGNLRFSDNRFELNWFIGTPVPLYAYIYHEYVRNFMGNQVSCPFRTETDTLRYRLAYSFAAGDSLTLVLAPDGELMNNWGTRDFVNHPDKELALTFCANLTRLYREKLKPFLFAGRMVPPMAVSCGSVTLPGLMGEVNAPSVLSSAWRAPDGSRIQLLVNPSCASERVNISGISYTVPPLDAIAVEF